MKKLKQFGQHFLTDLQLAKDMVQRFVDECPTQNVLEIGPGEGVITQFLLTHKSLNYKIVEVDDRLIQYLPKKYNDIADKLIHADFLQLNISELFDGAPFSVIGNFPYNISSQIVFKILDHKEQIPFMAGMFQREFADRVVSRTSQKSYGIPSVFTQMYYETTKWNDVSPLVFDPPPKVWSSIISIKRKDDTLPDFDMKKLKLIVKTAFNNRRKMLRNTLAPFDLPNHERWERMKTQRPEELSYLDYIFLTQLLNEK